MTTLTIRTAATRDIPRLAELRLQFRGPRAANEEREAEFLARCSTWMRERLDAGRWMCWVAETDGGIIGNVWLSVADKMPNPTREPERHAYVTNFFVVEPARGKGVGSALLARLLAWCAAETMHAAFLWPTEETRPLYVRHGFSANGEVMQRLFFTD